MPLYSSETLFYRKRASSVTRRAPYVAPARNTKKRLAYVCSSSNNTRIPPVLDLFRQFFFASPRKLNTRGLDGIVTYYSV